MNFREFYLKEEKFIPKYFEMLPNGDLKLFNVKLIPDNILSKINSYMKRKGYDIRGIDDVRRILLNHENNSYGGVLSKEYSKDLIDAILLSLPKEKTPEEKIRSRVGRYFGITDDFKVAGYITPDGKLLDFSGRKQGNPFPVYRTIDHRQVGYAFENTEFEDKFSGTEGMNDFMDLGYVRISWPHSIHIRKPLTPQQRLTIQKFIRDSYAEDITLSLEGMKEPIYQKFETKEYKYNPSKLIQFIDRYFSSGFNKDSLTQRFHESNGNFDPNSDNINELNLTEMPHSEVDGRAIDFKLEKQGWDKRLIALIKNIPPDKIDDLLKPFYRLQYKKVLLNRFNNLDVDSQSRLLKVLPVDFIEDMNLSLE